MPPLLQELVIDPTRLTKAKGIILGKFLQSQLKTALPEQRTCFYKNATYDSPTSEDTKIKFVLNHLLVYKNCKNPALQHVYVLGKKLGIGLFSTIHEILGKILIFPDGSLVFKAYETEQRMVLKTIKINDDFREIDFQNELKITDLIYDARSVFLPEAEISESSEAAMKLPFFEGDTLQTLLENDQVKREQQFESDTQQGFLGNDPPQCELQDKKVWSLKKRVRILANLAYKLQLIHEKDILHRDLKPGNIICNTKKFDKIFVFDFSLSTQNSSDNYICGSPRYATPEHIQSDSNKEEPLLTKETDVFIFCLIALEVLGGINKEFSTEEMETTQLNFEDRQLFSGIPSRNADIEEQLKAILRAGTHFDPKARVSLAIILKVLERILIDLKVEKVEAHLKPYLLEANALTLEFRDKLTVFANTFSLKQSPEHPSPNFSGIKALFEQLFATFPDYPEATKDLVDRLGIDVLQSARTQAEVLQTLNALEEKWKAHQSELKTWQEKFKILSKKIKLFSDLAPTTQSLLGDYLNIFEKKLLLKPKKNRTAFTLDNLALLNERYTERFLLLEKIFNKIEKISKIVKSSPERAQQTSLSASLRMFGMCYSAESKPPPNTPLVEVHSGSIAKDSTVLPKLILDNPGTILASP